MNEADTSQVAPVCALDPLIEHDALDFVSVLHPREASREPAACLPDQVFDELVLVSVHGFQRRPVSILAENFEAVLYVLRSARVISLKKSCVVPSTCRRPTKDPSPGSRMVATSHSKAMGFEPVLHPWHVGTIPM